MDQFFNRNETIEVKTTIVLLMIRSTELIAIYKKALKYFGKLAFFNFINQETD